MRVLASFVLVLAAAACSAQGRTPAAEPLLVSDRPIPRTLELGAGRGAVTLGGPLDTATVRAVPVRDSLWLVGHALPRVEHVLVQLDARGRVREVRLEYAAGVSFAAVEDEFRERLGRPLTAYQAERIDGGDSFSAWWADERTTLSLDASYEGHAFEDRACHCVQARLRNRRRR